MQTEFHIGKKKDVYPSKKTINLYYKESDSTKISTIVLDVLFVVVVLFGLAKFLVIDVMIERNDALEKLESAQRHLDQQMEAIADYDEISNEYARYSYVILADAQGVHDRTVILEMLEETVFQKSTVSNVSIVGNVVTLNYSGLDLNGTAQLIEQIESYAIVASVQVNNQTGSIGSGSHSGNMVITLTEAGGEQ